jgi:GTP cyclohydrolase II
MDVVSTIRPELEVVAQAPLPTKHGVFQTLVFHWREQDAALGLSPDHVALVMGDVRGATGVLVRVHSECITGEVFGSLKCDCRAQFDKAKEAIGRRGQGVLLYLRQEGRGIGLANKIRAYQLQSKGHDTVDANRMLGLPDDAREYGAAAAVLSYLGVKSVQVMTNNPHKLSALRALDVEIEEQRSMIVEHTSFSAGYLETKRVRMGHILPPIAPCGAPSKG